MDATMLDFTDGLPGPVIMNRFGETRRHQPKIGARAVNPFVPQAGTTLDENIDVEQRPGHGIETGRKGDIVKLERARLCSPTG
jgi:hypothetical protein